MFLFVRHIPRVITLGYGMSPLQGFSSDARVWDVFVIGVMRFAA